MQFHLFITDPLETLNYELDTSLKIARSLRHLGHTIAFTTQEALSLDNTGAKARVSLVKDWHSESLPQLEHGKTSMLSEFSAIHFRTDPPTDERYWSTTWILDKVPPKTTVFNSPNALRSLNEKLLIFDFPEASAPALLSCDPLEISDFIQKCCRDHVIAKPLTLFGGRGVEQYEFTNTKEQNSWIVKVTENGKRAMIFQPFDKGIFQGEIRAFAFNGKCYTWCLKKPAKGQFLANTRAGATLEPYRPTQEITEKLNAIAQALTFKGVHFIGFDVIGENVSEINITSPRLLTANPNSQVIIELSKAIERFIREKHNTD